MSDEDPPETGGSIPPRQHAFPTPVAPPPGRPRQGAPGQGPWGPPGPGQGQWGAPGAGRRPWGPPGPGNGTPNGNGAPNGNGTPNGNGWWWQGGRQAPPPPQRRSSGSRGLLWTLAIIAVVVLLVRDHRISSTDVILFCILVPSLILHEVSHGLVALAFGDDTARRAGRLSLNPLRHVDLVGTIIVPAITVLSGFGFFGWAKPVPVNVQRLRSPRNQGVLVALAGPLTNVVLAAVSGLLFYAIFVAGRPLPALTGLAPEIVFDIGVINLWVACFNLIPIPPLDGSAVIERLLPSAWWPGYLRIRPYGLIVIIGGLVLLSMAHVYPLDAVFGHISLWWQHLLGV